MLLIRLAEVCVSNVRQLPESNIPEGPKPVALGRPKGLYAVSSRALGRLSKGFRPFEGGGSRRTYLKDRSECGSVKHKVWCGISPTTAPIPPTSVLNPKP